MKRVAVYCGSSPGHDAAYALAAKELGWALAERGHGLVYGGGRVGLMGIVADAVLDRGGDVRGVLPRALDTTELAHAGLTELFVVESMHERKAKMTELADAFVAMPGGFGTLDELFEAVTWAQLGFHQKPVGLLNVKGYFDSLVAFRERAIREGFVLEAHRNLFVVDSSPEALLDRLEHHVMPVRPKWSLRGT